MKVDVLNIEGASTGKSVDLPDSVFGVEVNEHAIYLAVKQYNANQRQGTHKTKEKGEITGSTKKLKKQKGTGTARAGSIKSGVFRGGGRFFGPKPRNYSFKVNKKVKALARASAFTKMAQDGKIVVVEDFTFDQPKTSEFKNIVNAISGDAKRKLLLTGDYDMNVYRSGRNVQKTTVMNAKDVNTYAVLNSDKVIISESALATIKETFA